jgi:tRNA G18 (ribose-2'-O)-methylase SpoU
MARGYCAIGIVHGKTRVNFGTLLRSAELLGASFAFTIGARFRRESSDTRKSWRHMPVFEFDHVPDLVAHLPYSCPLVGVELDDRAVPLEGYSHPERACYLLGAEDHGLTTDTLARCHSIVRLPGIASMNVAAAGTVVLYDRVAKLASPPHPGLPPSRGAR